MISVQDIINYYTEKNPNKSPSTYSTMRFNIIRLEKITQKDINDLSKTDFMNIKLIMTAMDTYSLNTKIQTLMGIKLFIRFREANGDTSSCLEHTYNEELKKLCATKQEKEEKNEMTENESKNWIDYEDLKDKMNQFYEYSYSGFVEMSNGEDKFTMVRNFLLLALYIYLPPTRIGNYKDMVIRTQKTRKGASLDKKFNYLMVNNNGDKVSYVFIFNQYKTAKFVGQIEHKINNHKLDRIITLYLERRDSFVNKKSNTSFLINKDKKGMTQSNITDTLKYISRKIVGKELSVNLLRHIYLTYYLGLGNSIELNKKTANFMGQTYDATQMEKYKKIKKTDIEKSSVSGLNGGDNGFVINFD
tara:strand:+ start:21094 stop:22173 length:1080 start_codon:yes stop_codon:yes gene_type:complete